MTPGARAALDAYYAAGDSWAADRNDALQRSRRVAWRVAAAATVVAVCEALALMLLAPLKTVEPYTLMVDRQTGFVQRLKPLDTQVIAPDRALTRSFLAQYVIAREGFDIDSLQDDYRKVASWSEGSARAAYVAGMQASSPDSPLARLPRSAVIDVRVKTVVSLADNVALVRFATIAHAADGRPATAQDWAAVIRYHFNDAAMSAEERLINPLGFRVTRYRRSAETVPDAAATPMPSATLSTAPAAASRTLP
jgi:type IV secretion system protein VirB8